MNILDVIKNCIASPYFARDYDVEEFTMDDTSDAKSITNESAFSGLSALKKANADSKTSSAEQGMLRLYMRIWTGIRNAIYKIVSNGNCFISMELGYFYPMKGARGFAYSPTLETLEKYNYSLAEDPYNIKPTNCSVTLHITVRLLYLKYSLHLKYLLSIAVQIKIQSKLFLKNL